MARAASMSGAGIGAVLVISGWGAPISADAALTTALLGGVCSRLQPVINASAAPARTRVVLMPWPRALCAAKDAPPTLLRCLAHITPAWAQRRCTYSLHPAWESRWRLR